MSAKLISIGGKPLLIGGKAFNIGDSVVDNSNGDSSNPAGPLGIMADVRTTYAGVNANEYPHPVGNIRVVNAVSPITLSISDPSAKYDLSGSTISNTGGVVTAGTYPVTITATEAGSGRTVSQVVNLQATSGKGIYISQTRISNASAADFKVGMNAVDITSFEDITWSLVDPSGQFGVDPHYWYLYFRNGKAPPVGTYPVTVRVTNKAGVALDTNFTLEVYQEPAQSAPTFTPVAINSADVARTVIGKLSAYNDLGVYNYTLTDPSGIISPTIGVDGVVRLKADLPPVGAYQFTATVSNGSTSASKQFTLTVTQGYVIDAGSMTLAVASGLENYSYNQVIGTPSVSGVTGKKQWSIKHESDDYLDYFGNPQKCFNIDADTGLITAPFQLPARHPSHPVIATPGHEVEVTCRDGVNRCTQKFIVPVAWKTSSTTLYVGQGMAAAHPGTGYEHWSDLLPTLSPSDGKLPSDLAGATVKIAYNGDPDYYACDNGGGENGFAVNYQNRFGIAGPITIEALDPTGPRPRMGGLIGSGSGGVDISGKGFLTFSCGDAIVRGLEVSFVQGVGDPAPGGDNSHGVTGVRKNAQVYGDFFVVGCHIHDCNNNIETGFRPGRDYIFDNILGNAGTAYVSSGATHNLYAGATPYLHFRGNLTYRAMNGHALKSRAFKGLVEDSRMYDSENGSSSTVIDIPQGGQYIFRNNLIHKGPNAQNAGALQIAADGDRQRIHTFDVYNNTFSIQSLTEHYGVPCVVNNTPILSLIDGKDSIVNFHDNSYYLAENAIVVIDKVIGAANSNATSSSKTIVGSNTKLTEPPVLDFTDNGTANPKAGRLGFYNSIQEQTPGNNYDNYYQVQTDAGTDDMRVSVNAGVGTVIGNLTAYGANLWKNHVPFNASKVNPFATGATFSIIRDLDPYYYGGGNPFAPVGRYNIAATSATTAEIRVAGPLVVGTDFIKIRATAPDGTIADTRYYVSVVAA